MSTAPTIYGSRQSRESSNVAGFRALRGGVPCLDFVNTIARHDDPAATDDLGSGYVRLIEWCEYAELVDAPGPRRLAIAAGKDPREAASVRRRALGLRAALHRILQAIVTGDTPDEGALAILNQELQRARAAESLVAGGNGLVWQVQGPSTLESPLLVIARDAATVLTSDQASRIRQCAGPACERYFLDTSRNGSRRFCSATGCGSLERVRRFRERQKQSA